MYIVSVVIGGNGGGGGFGKQHLDASLAINWLYGTQFIKRVVRPVRGSYLETVLLKCFSLLMLGTLR